MDDYLHPGHGADAADPLRLHPSEPGDTYYIEAWGPWIAITLLWLIPLMVGLALAVIATTRGAGKLAWLGIVIHGLLLAFFVTPNVIDRLINR